MSNQRGRGGFAAVRIHGDHFEIETRAQRQQRIVRSHRDMLAAGLRPNAQALLDPIAALAQVLRDDDQVVGFDA